jgi:hypothetical protein
MHEIDLTNLTVILPSLKNATHSSSTVIYTKFTLVYLFKINYDLDHTEPEM